MYCGREYICPYIVGVATREESRHKKHMTTLLEQGLMDWNAAGAKFAFLSPADEKIYQPLGFQGVYYRNPIEVSGNRKKWYHVVSFSRLEPAVRDSVVEFAAAQLYMSDIDVYVCRSFSYYEMLHKEVSALNGKVIVLRKDHFIKAVAAYTHEDDSYEVTEVICAPEDGRKVMESICAYLGENDTKKIVFSDTRFLGKIEGEEIVAVKEKKPYIMAKMLGNEESMEGLDVYINDIT
jgi:predicted acetyltransferase